MLRTTNSFALVGELALTGQTRPVKRILSMALQAASEGRDGILVPRANAAEAAVVEGLDFDPICSLTEAVGFLSGQLDKASLTERNDLPDAPNTSKQ